MLEKPKRETHDLWHVAIGFTNVLCRAITGLERLQLILKNNSCNIEKRQATRRGFGMIVERPVGHCCHPPHGQL